jgi:Right handed beta helix region
LQVVKAYKTGARYKLFIEDLIAGNLPWENPQVHGAVGDGVANDRAAIQEAIDSLQPRNLITNGDFEGVDVLPWTPAGTNTMTVSTEQSRYGTHSAKCTYGNNAVLAQYVVTLRPTSHKYSLWMYIPSDWDGNGLHIRVEGFTGATNNSVPFAADMDIRDEWQRIECDFTVVAGDPTGILRIQRDGAPTVGRSIYVDGALLQEGTLLRDFDAPALGGALVAPPGTYAVRGLPLLVPSKVSIEGFGAATEFKLDDTSLTELFRNDDWTNGNEDIAFRRFKINGGLLTDQENNVLPEAHLIHTFRMKRLRIEDIDLANGTGDGVRVDMVSSADENEDVIIRDIFTDNVRVAVRVRGTSHCTIANVISSNGRFGTYVHTNSQHVTMTDCHARDMIQLGHMFENGTRHNVMKGCTAERCGVYGLNIESAPGAGMFVMSACGAEDMVSGSAFRIYGENVTAGNCWVEGRGVYNNTAYGFDVHGANITINAPTIRGVLQNGIRARSFGGAEDGVVITGPQIDGSDGNGVSVTLDGIRFQYDAATGAADFCSSTGGKVVNCLHSAAIIDRSSDCHIADLICVNNSQEGDGLHPAVLINALSGVFANRNTIANIHAYGPHSYAVSDGNSGNTDNSYSDIFSSGHTVAATRKLSATTKESNTISV